MAPIVLFLFLAAACGSNTIDSSSASTETLVLGVVKDMNGAFLSDVTVTAVDTSTSASTTDTNGYFSITGLSENKHLLVSFEKTGYVKTFKIAKIQSQQGDFLVVNMSPYDTTGNVSSSETKTITDTKGASIKINANSLVNSSGGSFSGTATAYITSYDLSTTAGINTFPGEYIGIGTNGTVYPLQTFGFVDISVTDSNGNALSIANGNSATITVPIPTSLQSSAASTIPLWHFDQVTGKWNEMVSTGTKSGNYYTAIVTSFSTWNFDLNYSPAYVSGRVTDCDTGVAVKGARVSVLATGMNSSENSTGADGRFPNTDQYYSTSWQGIPVTPSADFLIWAEKSGKKSTVSGYTSGAANYLKAVGDICIYTVNGTFDGSFSGDDTGTYTAIIAQNGLITGNGYSNGAKNNFTISGHMSEDGKITMGVTSLNNTVFSGRITAGNPSTVSGTWTNSLGNSGTFTGTEQ